MAIIIKDENNTRMSPLKVTVYDRFTPSLISTIPRSFSYGSAVVLNDEIHILGGSINQKAHYKYSNGQWVQLTNLPYELDEGHLAVVLNNEIHVLGLKGDDERYISHYKYSNGQWVSVSTLPHTIHGGSAIVLNDEIHILGGSNYTSHYKYSNGNWVYVSNIPYVSTFASAVVLDNEIHILGGKNKPKGHYKYSNGEWVSVSTLPYDYTYNSGATGIKYGSAVVLDNEIHILGGSINQSAHYKYSKEQWVQLTDLPITNFYAGVALVIVDNFEYNGFKNYLYILMGTSHYLVEELQYNYLKIAAPSDEWIEAGNLPSDFGNSGVSVIYNGEVHILGLNNGTGHYKLTNSGWISVSTLPIAIGAYEYFEDPLEGDYECYTCGSIVVLNDKIHLLYHNKHYTWDPTNGWNLLSNNAPLYANGNVIVFNNEIHILGYWYFTGGLLGPDPEGDHYVYSNGQWSIVNPGTYQDETYRMNDLAIIRGGIKSNSFIYNDELYLLSNDYTTWDSVARKSYKRLFKWNGNINDSIWTEITTAQNVIQKIIDNNSNQRKSSITLQENFIDYFYENSQYRFDGTTWVLISNNNVFSIKYGGDVKYSEDNRYVFSGTKYYSSELTPLPTSHYFNKIKDIWTKVKVPMYDQYGNCHIEEQAKKVKAVWVGGPDNKAKRIFY